MKQYIGISRDHSISMSGLRTAAMKDYNETIVGIKDAANQFGTETVVSVVECGRPATASNRNGYNPWSSSTPAIVLRDVVNQNVKYLNPLTNYVADGRSTPLLDSVGELIEIMENVPWSDRNDPTVSF